MLRWKLVLPLWCAAPLLLWLSLYRPAELSADRSQALPTEIGGFVAEDDYPITERMVELLGSEDAVWRRYRHPELGDLFVIGVFHGSNWRAVHPPHTCLQGANLEIQSERNWEDHWLDDRKRGHGEIRLQSRGPDGREYLSYFVYVAAPDLTTASYWEFFWHHAPRALFRRPLAGALLRIETWVDENGLEAARRRCGTMLTELVPEVEASLR